MTSLPTEALVRLEQVLIALQPDEMAQSERVYIQHAKYRQFKAALTTISTGRQLVSRALLRLPNMRLEFVEVTASPSNPGALTWCYKVVARPAAPNRLLNFTLAGDQVKIHSGVSSFAAREASAAELSSDVVVEAFADFIESLFKASL